MPPAYLFGSLVVMAALHFLLLGARWYHALHYVANAAAVPLERWAAPWPR
ncbi:MAG TPA: hypothetical protein VL359_07390 [bacterium]|nr:hypothetical protein [bacterium]